MAQGRVGALRHHALARHSALAPPVVIPAERERPRAAARAGIHGHKSADQSKILWLWVPDRRFAASGTTACG
jgi:hypothetical protein